MTDTAFRLAPLKTYHGAATSENSASVEAASQTDGRGVDEIAKGLYSLNSIESLKTR